MTSTNPIELLHPGLQRWMGEEGWSGLHKIQLDAIQPLLNGEDALVMAPTAGGKTEAVFLPLLTRLVGGDSGCILAVSPLKALINDQHHRIEEMTRHLDISCHRWHGDVTASERKKFTQSTRSVLLITPESLEAGLVRRSPLISAITSRLSAIVVDELHAFIGTERGMHLRSLLSRIEQQRGHAPVQRVGISATIGDPTIAAHFLRQDAPDSVHLLCQSSAGTRMRLQLRGLEADPEDGDASMREVADDLFRKLRGRSNLVFANSRNRVEDLADKLRRLSEEQRVPQEFFPHHGNLSREIRYDLEARFREGNRPTTAICTSTLELGVDIGVVSTVAQVGAPFTVSSLRQRLGRSGRRRGEVPTLRMYVTAPAPTVRTAVVDDLRLEVIQAAAMMDLLLDSWTEPGGERIHLSTLVHQILAVLCERGGVSAAGLWNTLCRDGAFNAIDQPIFMRVLRDLGSSDVIYQLDDSLLALTEQGDRITNSHDFYAAFESPDEFRVIHDGVTLGTLPIDGAIAIGTTIVFAGRRWSVEQVDIEGRTLLVRPSKFGRPPMFLGGGGLTDRSIHEKMFRMFLSDAQPTYMDSGALELLKAGRAEFARLNLRTRRVIGTEQCCYIFAWAGDCAHGTLALWLRAEGVDASLEGASIRCDGIDPDRLKDILHGMRTGPLPQAHDIASMVENVGGEKFHHLLSHEICVEEFERTEVDIPVAHRALADFA